MNDFPRLGGFHWLCDAVERHLPRGYVSLNRVNSGNTPHLKLNLSHRTSPLRDVLMTEHTRAKNSFPVPRMQSGSGLIVFEMCDLLAAGPKNFVGVRELGCAGVQRTAMPLPNLRKSGIRCTHEPCVWFAD